MKGLIALLALGMMTTQVIGQPRLPSKNEIAGFKKLAAQSVVHVETSLKKIESGTFSADAARLRVEVTLPAIALLKDWKKFGLSDAILMSYSACQSMLGDIQVYADESKMPPRYHLSEAAQRHLKFINEDLVDCRSLRQEMPDFAFARE